MAAQLGVAVAERLTLGDPEHLGDQVETRHLLRHRVLHLQAGVHLEEGDGAVLADQELARPRPDVAGLEQDRLRGGVEAVDLLRRQVRRGRLLDELLMAALQRAVPGGDHHHVPVGIGQTLRLDVPGAIQVALDEALAATERTDRLPGGGLEEIRDLGQLAGDLEPAPPAAVSRLDRDREPVLGREREDLVGVGHRFWGARDERRAHLLGDVTGLDLVAERLDGRGRRADPDQTGVDHRLGEGGVLGQEPVPGVNRVGPGSLGHGEDLGDVQVAVSGGRSAQRVRLVGQLDEQSVRVRVGVHGDAADPGVRGCPDHPDGDLSPVRDEHLGDGPLGSGRRADGHGGSIVLAQRCLRLAGRRSRARVNRTVPPGRSWPA